MWIVNLSRWFIFAKQQIFRWLPSFVVLQGLISNYGKEDPRLPSLGPLASTLGSVSGLSAGGSKAFQFYLSHSSELRGVGIFSGLMHECGFGVDAEVFKLRQCTTGHFNYAKVVNRINQLAETGLFDPLHNLESRKHFVFHGTNDIIVSQEEGKQIARFFTEMGTSRNVKFVITDAAHSLPTLNCGDPCSRKFPIARHACLNCGWSAAFAALNFIYNGTLKLPESKQVGQCETADNEIEGLFPFDQREFFPPQFEAIINMGKTGYIYIPTRCQYNSSLCSLHIHIHGCGLQVSSPLIGKMHLKCSGILEVAEANNIIVLFPQGAVGTSSISSVIQCWDFVGYTGPNYGTKKGLQVKAIKNMFDRIMGINSLA